MAVSRERKVLIAVAGVAAALVVADRVLLNGSLGGPQSAEAAGVPGPAAAAVSLTASADAPPTPADKLIEAMEDDRDRTTLADRLASIDSALPPRTPDAFRASPRWDRPAPTPEAAPAVPRESFDPRRFAEDHPLDAVYLAEGRAYAMVAGRMMHVGDRRGRMELTEIGDRWVVWTGHGMRVKVRLDPVR
ncbi:MAG: hypothetical protein AAFX76_09105 [Planctomycetota bacterium]